MSERKNLLDPVAAESAADRLLEATLPIAGAHATGDLGPTLRVLAEDPAAATADIWVACACGEADAVRAFLAADATLASRQGGTRNWEPLLYLCFSRFLKHDADRAERMVEIGRLLLEAGADPGVRWIDPAFNDSEETPLYGAAGVANNPEMARILIEAGADPNDGETPYHMVEHPGVPCAEFIFPKLDDNARGTALAHQLDYPDLEGLRVLLELGADPNGPNPFKNKALHQAVFRGRGKATFDLLLAHGADVNLANGDGKTAYALAARAGRAEIMGWLADAGAVTDLDPVDEFVGACALGDKARAEAALAANPDLRSRFVPADVAAICDAADAGNTDGVRTMLEMGWNVNTRGTIWAETPLHRAAMCGHLDTVELLLDAGADLSIRDCSYQSSPFGWALHGGHRDVAARIVADPARLDLRDAIEAGCTERALELLGDTDINGAILGGDPGVLLRAAAASGNLDMVRELLGRGADPSLANTEGMRAIDIARERAQEEIVALLAARE